MSTTIKAGWLKDSQGNKFAPKTMSSQVQMNDGTIIEDKLNEISDNAIAHSNANLESAKTYTDESVVKYDLSKNGTTITLTGTDESVSSIEESVTTATDDGAGNVTLESAAAISYVDEITKQEIIDATLASLKTEALTFTLDDGTTVTKEVVVK